MANISTAGFNNVVQRKSGWRATRYVNVDTIQEYTAGQGVQVVDGASSTKRLETSTPNQPVVFNSVAPPVAGYTPITTSTVNATWQPLNGSGFASADASFITTSADANLTDERVIQAGNGTTLVVGAGTVEVNLEDLGVAGTEVSPSITADVYGRTTAFSANSGVWTEVVATGNATAGNNVASVDTARYQYFVLNDKLIVNVFIQFTSDNPLDANDGVITIDSFPLTIPQTFSGLSFINDTNNLRQEIAYLTLDNTETITLTIPDPSANLAVGTQYTARGQIQAGITL